MTRMTIDLFQDRLSHAQRQELITCILEALVPADEEMPAGPTWLRIDVVRSGDWGEKAFTAAGFFALAFGKAV